MQSLEIRWSWGCIRPRCFKYFAYFKGQTETTIDEAFTVMYLLICKMFENENVDIDTKEIEHSYCPGRFDLSIDGKICWYFTTTGTWRYCSSNLFMC